jgi:spermidine/putrescine transport system permease protein
MSSLPPARSQAGAEAVGAVTPRVRVAPKLSIWTRMGRHTGLALGIWSAVVFGFLFLPIVVLVIFSFNKQPLNVEWTGFTWRWYVGGGSPGKMGVFHDPVIQRAFLTSMQLAIFSTIGGVVLGTLGALALDRYEFRSRNLWDGMNYVKMVIAEVVAGVSTLLFFVQINELMVRYLGFNFWGLFSPGFYTVLIAHIAWNIPFVVVIVRARLRGLDKYVEEAGSDLYGRPVTVFFKVTLPAIWPAILAGALLSFTLSFDNFVTTFFTAGPEVNTLPLQIWAMVRMGITPEINAVSTLMVALSTTIVIVLELKARVSKSIV